MVTDMTIKSGMSAKWKARYRLVVRQHALGAALVVAALLAGALFGAYWPTLAAFIRINGAGTAALKFAPIAGPTLGFIVFWWQVQRARFNQRIDLILKLAERFDKLEMRASRSKAARALRTDCNTEEGAVEDVLSFFEELGFLLARNAVDTDAVYEFFEYWAIQYHQATEQYRHRMRKCTSSSDLYKGIDELFGVLRDLELAKTRQPPDRTAAQLDDFLAEESKLVPRPKSSLAERMRSRRG